MKAFLLTLLLICIGALAYASFRSTRTISFVSDTVPPVSYSSSLPLLFVGDIMLGRYVEELSASDHTYPFIRIKDFLKGYQVVANLEGPIPREHVQTPIQGFTFSQPLYTPLLLKAMGITAVSLANNHAFDYGYSGWEETKQALDAAGIAHTGSYQPTQEDVWETKLGSTTVLVYGINMIATGWNETQALEVTAKLRSEHKDAYIIAFLHWGNEYDTQKAVQQEFAHKLIDGGVDAIVGSHPHVVQGIELYKNKPIFYSLGNFIFDQYFSKEVQEGLTLSLTKKENQMVYTLMPIIEQRSVPRLSTSTDVLARVAHMSDPELFGVITRGELAIPSPK